jgi:hypothetical protein
MQVTLTPHGEELLKDQLARHAGSSPEQILERALETLASEAPVLTPEEQERRRQAVDAMRPFSKKHHLALGPGERIQDLIHEGHRS